jgi:single-stranded DNA-binding protein
MEEKMTASGTAIGYIGRAPERRSFGNYDMATSSLATRHGYGDKAKTTWWNLTAFGKAAEALLKLQKGQQVAVHGEFFEDTYKGSDGIERKQLKIDVKTVTFFSGFRDDTNQPTEGNESHDEVGKPAAKKADIPTDDDVPF